MAARPYRSRTSSHDRYREQQERELREYHERQVQQHGYRTSSSTASQQQQQQQVAGNSTDPAWVPQYPPSPRDEAQRSSPRFGHRDSPSFTGRNMSPRATGRSMMGRGSSPGNSGQHGASAASVHATGRGVGYSHPNGSASDFHSTQGHDFLEVSTLPDSASSTHLSFHTNPSQSDFHGLNTAGSDYHTANPHTTNLSDLQLDARGRGSPRRAATDTDYLNSHQRPGNERQRSFQGREGSSQAGRSPLRNALGVDTSGSPQQQDQRRTRSNSQHTQASYSSGYRPQVRGQQQQPQSRSHHQDQGQQQQQQQPGRRDLVDNARAFAASATSGLFGAAQVGAAGALTGAPPSAAVPTTNLRDVAAGDYDHGRGSAGSRHSDPDSSATGSYVAAMEMDELKGSHHKDDAAALKAAGYSADETYDRHGISTANSQAGGHEDSGDAEKIFAMYRNSGDSRRTDGSYTDALSMENDDDEDPKQATARDLFRYATKWNLFFNALGLLAAAAAGAAQPIMTIVFGNLTTAFLNFSSDVAEGRDPTRAKDNLRSAVNKDALILVYIGCAMFVATYVYMATWVYTGEEITRKIRERYLASILRQNIAYFDKVGAGEITTRIQSDIHLIQEGISDKIPMTVSFIATFVAGFVVAYKTSWKLALAMTSVVPCIVIMGALMNVLMQKVTQDELDNVAKAATIAEESLSTVRTAKAFGIESRLVALYDAFNRDSTVQGKTKAVIQGVGFGIFFVVIYCGYALAFYFGSKLIASGAVQSGTVMTVIFSIFIGAFSLALLAPNLTAWAFAKSAAAKIFETIDRVPEIDSSSPDGLRPAVCEGYIEVRNVSFRYPARRDVQVLAGYSVEIPRGKTTALVGASGSGKSTIVQLVERFYDPDAGQVLLDGVNLRDLNLQWLRSQIGLVSQEPVLFATTIRNNIGHGLINTPWQNASEEERERLIVDAAKQANIHATIVGLPNGYDTMVGERGFLLSGGQKQRIAIARAIVKNPRILLLDEATSALDTQSEGIVQDALDRAARGRTTITIAHRLSTIKNADNIVVMGKGAILEQGRHEELLANPNGPYANLVNAQKIRANTDAQHLYDDDENEAGFAAFKAQMPVELGRSSSRRSLASLVMRMRGENASQSPKRRSLFYLLYRLALINKDKIWTLYVPGILGSIASGAVYPAFSILFGLALDNFSKCGSTKGQACPEPARSDMRHHADRVSLYMFITALLSSVCIAAQNGCLMLASAHLVERLRRMMMLSYLRADVAYFDEDDHSSGALSSSLAGNAQKISGLVGVTMGTILQSIATLIIGFAIALGYGWKLSLVCIACTPLTLSAGFVRLKLVVLKDEKIKKAHEGSSQKACEAASAIRTVASLTREQECLRIFHEDLKEPTRITHNFAFKSNVLYALSQSLAFGVIALAFWYGSGLLIDQEYTSRQFFTVLTSVVFGSIQAGNVFNFVPDISNAHAAAEDSIKLIDNVPEIDAESDEGIVLDNCQGHVEFVGVRFRYPTRPGIRVLAGLDLEIRPGTYCALVGGSGCGKSTTIQLIERFYDPVVGKILIDGHDITTLNLKSLRRHIALVSQEPTLYDGTIAFNLRLGAYEDADKVTDDMLRKAASDANILQFIESLPNGFDTEVGGKGTQLSGGQKQRIAIARALIRDPKILLLDEATSALDSESEKVVQEALDKAARGRTTIAVAHRLSTISKSDRIFVLNSGIVSEMGTHSQLMALKRQYCELVKLQQLSGQE